MEENATEKAKKVRGRPFQKGQAGGPGRGNKKPQPALGRDVLEDLERAYKEPPRADDSEAVKSFRKMLKDDPSKFVAMYAKLKGVGEVGSDAGQAVAAAAGPKEQKVEELIEELLTSYEAEHALEGPHAQPG